MEKELEVKDLSFYYGKVRALENINLDIEKNTVTALIGPSGCGKSTFLRTLNRMNDLIDGTRLEGTIRFRGEDIYSGDMDLVDLRQRIGMIFQKANPFPKSIYENVIFGPKRHGIKDRKVLDELVEDSLRRTALWDEVKDKLQQSAFSLSGGQQQRLSIARVIAAKSEVILMDEPTSALDPLSTQKIEDLIQELKENYTIVIVTHNIQQAARISDATGFFLNGRLVEKENTKTLFHNPKDKKTEDYISGRFG